MIPVPRIRPAVSHRSRLIEYRRLFGVCPPLLLKIRETPSIGELDGLVAACGARGQELTPEERLAAQERRGELMTKGNRA